MYYEMNAEITTTRASFSVMIRNAWFKLRYRNYVVVSEKYI